LVRQTIALVLDVILVKNEPATQIVKKLPVAFIKTLSSCDTNLVKLCTDELVEN
jgi:hypothetical protein